MHLQATGAGGSIVLVGRGSLDVSLPVIEIAGKELNINGIFRYANA